MWDFSWLERRWPGAGYEDWDLALDELKARGYDWSRTTGKPLMTTESWGSVVFKDWPGLDWGWEKELCELGVRHAANTGRWLAISTSNFCGPQYVGMWRDVAWHRRLTDLIKSAQIDDDLTR
jgi:hypothetical protein